MLFEETVFIFQFLNNKMHNYVLFNTFVHFIIQKLKNKHTFIQTEKAKSSHFDRTRGDKNQIFPTLLLKPVTGQELFFAISYSIPALVNI